MAEQINSSSETKTPQNKKRSLSFMKAQEIEWKLKSKADFYQYLDKHRKSYLLYY